MSEKTVHAGHRARMRERFMKEGLSGFSEHEVLELLLMFAIPQRDVNPLAHRLIDRFGSLSAVLESSPAELTRVDGVGENAAALLSLMPQLMGYYQHSAMGRKPVITNLAEARKYAGALFFGLHEERVYMICVDQSGRVLHPALMHRGTIDQVQIYPREVVETALRYHAHAVLLAHNHPSGMAETSQDDYDSTRAVIGALNVIGVRVIDHLIFAGNSVYSMTQNSQFDGRQDEREISYIMRSRSVPGQRGTLREEQEDELIALQMDEWNGI